MAIATAWKIGTEAKTNKTSPFMVNCVSGPKNPVTWREIYKNLEESARKYPLGELI